MENIFLALFFFSFAAGLAVNKIKIPRIPSLGQYTCIMLCSLIAGFAASKTHCVDFGKLEPAINSMKSFLFLLFIFATGYVSGPTVFSFFSYYSQRKKGGPANNAIVNPGSVFKIALTIWISAIVMLALIFLAGGIRDKSLLGAIAAGALTQTSILGLTASPESKSSGVSPEVFFSLTYVVSTFVTVLYCSKVIPSLSKMIHRGPEKELIDDRGDTAISFKLLPVPDRVGRAFKANTDIEVDLLRDQLAANHLTIQGIFNSDGEFKTHSDAERIQKDEIVFVLGERKGMDMAEKRIGEEVFDIPLQWQKNFNFSSLSVFLTKPVPLRKVREACNKFNMCLEQIIAEDGGDITRSKDDTVLEKRTRIKLFGKKDDINSVSREIGQCFIVPKDKNTGIALLSLCIGLALIIALVPGIRYLGSGILTFGLGIYIGASRERCPKQRYGFPPQASTLFQTFGLGGYIVLSGLGASYKLSDLSLNSLGEFRWFFWILLVLMFVVPLIAGTIASFFVFKNNYNSIVSAAAVAGARSSNVAYIEILKNNGDRGKAQLESVFAISYSIANILLTLIGLIISSAFSFFHI